MNSPPFALLMYWIPPNGRYLIRDGGRWLIVSHTGDTAVAIEWARDGVFHLPGGVRWTVATTDTIPAGVREVSGV